METCVQIHSIHIKIAMETPARAEEEAAVSSAASVWRAEAHTDSITGC